MEIKKRKYTWFSSTRGIACTKLKYCNCIYKIKKLYLYIYYYYLLPSTIIVYFWDLLNAAPHTRVCDSLYIIDYKRILQVLLIAILSSYFTSMLCFNGIETLGNSLWVMILSTLISCISHLVYNIVNWFFVEHACLK